MSALLVRLGLGAAAFMGVSYGLFKLIEKSGGLSSTIASRMAFLLATLAAIQAMNNPGYISFSKPYMTWIFSGAFATSVLLLALLTNEPALALLAVMSTVHTAAVSHRTNSGPVLISSVLLAIVVTAFFTQSDDLSDFINRYRNFVAGEESPAPDDALPDSYLTGPNTIFMVPEIVGLVVGVFAYAVLFHGSWVNRKYNQEGDPDLRILLEPEGEGPENLDRYISRGLARKEKKAGIIF